MAEAAAAWLEMLDADQKRIACGAVPQEGPEDDERRLWYYTPTDHGGLTFHQQRPAQQRATMRLVSTGLSSEGYATVATVLGLENILDHTEGFTVLFDRDRGRDPSEYYLRVFGDPLGGGLWGWRFGGHHVSLNYLVHGDVVLARTPCFIGADPASSTLLGNVLNRPLAASEDMARELFVSLSGDLSQQALLLPKAPSDLVTANRTHISEGDRVIPLSQIWRERRFSDPVQQAKLDELSDAIDRAADYDESDHAAVEYTATPKGVPASELTSGQRQLLRDLLGTYLDRVPSELSPMQRYREDALLNEVHFAWAGSSNPGEPHYYRVQAPNLLIEWDNTQRGANHAHSVWRDPSHDFGMDALAQHRTRLH